MFSRTSSGLPSPAHIQWLAGIRIYAGTGFPSAVRKPNLREKIHVVYRFWSLLTQLKNGIQPCPFPMFYHHDFRNISPPDRKKNTDPKTGSVKKGSRQVRGGLLRREKIPLPDLNEFAVLHHMF